MPIKYNLTKYDILAEKIHELAQKRNMTSSDKILGDDDNNEKLLRAEAVLIASFASSHSWQTYKLITEGSPNMIIGSPDIKTEYELAKKDKWKRVKNTEIQDVARMNIKDNMFFTWLSINESNGSREIYRNAWSRLKQEFNEECDGISIKQH